MAFSGSNLSLLRSLPSLAAWSRSGERVRRVRTCTPPRRRPRGRSRASSSPREFTYLLLLLSLHALAVPELAPGVLDLSRRGVSQNSSFIRTNCRGQSRRLPREGRGLTFPESTKYFAGTISASLSRNRLQTSAPESVMAPPVNSSITPPYLSLSLSLSRSIAAAELVGDLELLFSPRACAQPSTRGSIDLVQRRDPRASGSKPGWSAPSWERPERLRAEVRDRLRPASAGEAPEPSLSRW